MAFRSRLGRFVVSAVAGASWIADASAARAAAQRPLTPAAALPSEEQLIERQRVFADRPHAQYWPEIEAKLKKGDYSAAEGLATAAIDAKDGDDNPQLAAYIRSLAFLHRAEARRQLGAASERVNRDVAAAARLGNLVAIRTLVTQYVESAEPEKPSTARVPPGVAIGEIFEVGLDLGSAYTLRAVANGFGPATPAQRALSGLLYALQSQDESLLDRIDDLARQTDLALLLSDTFVGRPFPSRSPASPPRDVLATLFAENALRHTLAGGFGFGLPEQQRTPAFSLREVMELNSWHGEMSGMATVYHLVAEGTDFHQHAFAASKPEVLNELRPGDTIHVRCGALAHTAVVWAVDRSRNELLLTDPLFQFWQPSHNACIETFRLVHFKYGFYFTQLKLSELRPIIDAIQTVRSYETPLFMARIGGSADQSHAAIREIADKTSTRCAGGSILETGLVGQPAQAGSSGDLFPAFRLRKHATQAVSGTTLTTTFYLPFAVQFMGKAAVATRGDPTGCVRSMSLFLRRSFLRSAQRIEANKLFSTFMDQVFRPREVEAWAVGPDTGRDVRERQSPLDRIVAVLSGARQSVTLKGNRLSAYVAGVRSEAGVEWIRIDAW